MVILDGFSCQQGGKRYGTLWLDGAIGGSQPGEHTEAVQGKLWHGDAYPIGFMRKDDLLVIQPEGGIPAH